MKARGPRRPKSSESSGAARSLPASGTTTVTYEILPSRSTRCSRRAHPGGRGPANGMAEVGSFTSYWPMLQSMVRGKRTTRPARASPSMAKRLGSHHRNSWREYSTVTYEISASTGWRNPGTSSASSGSSRRRLKARAGR